MVTLVGVPDADLFFQTVFLRDASLAFIFFIAFSLMVALGVRFTLYAALNRSRVDLDSQAVLWEYLVLVGLAAALYGALGGIEAATAVAWPDSVVTTPYRDGVLLAFLLLLASTMREIHDTGALVDRDGDDSAGARQRGLIEMGFGALVTATIVGAGVFGSSRWLTVLHGVAVLPIAAYGLYYGRVRLGHSSVQGTTIDSLLRHLLPVVTFATLVLLVDLVTLAGLSVGVARHVQAVFVIMTATTLMTSTIKLSQNVAGF